MLPLSLAQPLSLYVLVISALGTIFSSGLLSVTMMVISASFVVGSWFVPLSVRERLNRSKALAGLLIFFMLEAVYEVVSGRSDMMTAVTRFLVAILVSRLYTPRAVNDSSQILTLSLLAVLAGSALNTSFAFAPYFVAYVVASVWALTTTQLLKSASEGQAMPHELWISRGFLLTTSFLIAALFAQTAAFFLLFPRLGVTYFHFRARSAVATGYSDTVSLAGGDTPNDMTVVMRAEFPEGLSGDPEALYFRGSTLSDYDGKTWRRHPLDPERLTSDAEGLYRLVNAPLVNARQYRLFQEDNDTAAVFVLEPTIGFAFADDDLLLENRPDIHLVTDEAHDLTAQRKARMPLRLLGWLGKSTLARGHGPKVLAANLQLPASLSPAVIDLAKSWSDGETHADGLVKALSAHLDAENRYSMKLANVPEGKDGLSFFLLESHAGMCGHFATALAVMLRQMGVPARLVNGYHGASFNEFGHYYSIAEYRAHTWVEYYSPERGWVSTDPSPAGFAATETFSQASAFLDWARYRWSRYVVDYDLGAQFRAAQSVGRLLGGRGSWQMDRKSISRFVVISATALVLMLVVLNTLLGVWRRRDERKLLQATVLYRRFEDELHKRGCERDAGIGPNGFANQVASQNPELAGLAYRFTEAYVRARFAAAGQVSLREESEAEMKRLLKQLKVKVPSSAPSASS